MGALGAAQALLAQGWCRLAEARDQAGRPVHPRSLAARSWSITGAIYAGVRFDGSPERRALYQSLVTVLGAVLGMSPTHWNDRVCLTAQEALAAVDRVAERAGAPPFAASPVEAGQRPQ